MESTTITDFSQSLVSLDSSYVVTKKEKSKGKFLLTLKNRFRMLYYSIKYPEGEDTERYYMKKFGMSYCPRETLLHFDVPIELEAYYILLIEVMFKEKISTFSKEQVQKDYSYFWNQKLLDLYYSCTESDLSKIAFLATHPLVSIKGLFLGVFGATAKNLRIIFAKHSPHIDLCSFAAQNWESNPFLAEIERPGYFEEIIKPTIIELSTTCLKKPYLILKDSKFFTKKIKVIFYVEKKSS